MRARWTALTVTLLAASLTGCGISTSGGPHAIPASELPNLPAPPPTTSPVSGCPANRPVPVAIVLLDELNNPATPTARARCVAQPGRLDAVVGQLLLGPNASELSQGISTAVPAHTTLLDLNTSAQGIVNVDLSAEFVSGSSTSQEQEVEQVVYTLACATKDPATPVSFEVEGSPQPVPIATGATVTRPVTAADDYDFGDFACEL
jgi:Sporulation and spore germination